MGLGIGIGIVYAAMAKVVAASKDKAVQPKLTIKPMFEERERYEDRTGKSFDTRKDLNREDLFTRTRAGISFAYGNDTSGVVEYQYVSNPYWTHTLNASTDGSDLILGYVQQKVGNGNVDLGRQRIAIGNGRILADGDWTYRSTSWDAVQYQGNGLDVFGGTIAVTMKQSEEARLGGGAYDWGGGKTLFTFAHDRISATGTSNIYTVDHTVTKKLGTFSLFTELDGQMGKTGTSDLRAWAATERVTKNFGSKFCAFIEGNVDSGGKSGNTSMEFTEPYSALHSFNGTADVQGAENVKQLSIGAKYQARPNLSFDATFYNDALFDDRDAWFCKTFTANKTGSVTFIDPTGKKGGDVGREFDLGAKWKANKNTELCFGFADFLPGNYVKAFIPASFVTDQKWFYTSVSFKF
jgi:hypothetical protein